MGASKKVQSNATPGTRSKTSAKWTNSSTATPAAPNPSTEKSVADTTFVAGPGIVMMDPAPTSAPAAALESNADDDSPSERSRESESDDKSDVVFPLPM